MLNSELIPKALLDTLPPLYSTEGTPLKEKAVCLKLFCSSMTWYVVEAQACKDSDDILLFCYVENSSDPWCSEWGYTSLGELEKLTLTGQRRSDRFFGTYVERDLHFTPAPITELVDL